MARYFEEAIKTCRGRSHERWERLNQLRVDAELDRRCLGVEVCDALLEDRFMAEQLRTLRASALTAAKNSICIAAKKVAESYGRGRRASSRGYDLRAAEAEVCEKVAEALRDAPAHLTSAELKKLKVHAAQSAGHVYCNRVQSSVACAGSPTPSGTGMPP